MGLYKYQSFNVIQTWTKRKRKKEMKYSRIGSARNRAQYGFTPAPSLIITLLMLMATRFSLSRSAHFCLKTPAFSRPTTKNLLQCRSCPLWSSSFALCLHTLPKSTPPSPHHRRKTIAVRSFCPAPGSISDHPTKMTTATSDDNPLLKDFYFPPFDSIEAKHVRPGIRALLKQVVCFFFSFVSLLALRESAWELVIWRIKFVFFFCFCELRVG